MTGPLHAAEYGVSLSRDVALDHHLVTVNVDNVESPGSTALPFAISTGAKRSGGSAVSFPVMDHFIKNHRGNSRSKRNAGTSGFHLLAATAGRA